MEEVTKPDRRVIRTKRAIRNAFAKLLAERELNDITVRDIADYADINRKTFYNYYEGIYQVVDEIENEIINAFVKTLDNVDFRRDMKKPYQIFEKLNSIISTDIEFYGFMLSMNGNVSLISKLADSMKNMTKETMKQQGLPLTEKQMDMILNYAVHGMLKVYQQWFISDRTQPLEEISELIGEMCFYGFNGMITRHNS